MPGQTHRTLDSSTTVTTLNPNLTIALGTAAILVPAVIIFSILARRRYRQHSLRSRIAKLERSWDLQSTQKMH